MWIKRNDSIIYFNINDVDEICIKKNIFNTYKLCIKYKNNKTHIFCKSKKYDIILNIFNLIIDSINKNNAISLEIPFFVKNKL